MNSSHDAEALNAEWYAVRCVFQCGDAASFTYEERITLWQAASFDEAIALAESEAQEHAAVVGFRFVGLAQAYAVADEIGHGAEVYSLMRDSELPADDYLAAFFDTGSERQGTVPGSG